VRAHCSTTVVKVATAWGLSEGNRCPIGGPRLSRAPPPSPRVAPGPSLVPPCRTVPLTPPVTYQPPSAFAPHHPLDRRSVVPLLLGGPPSRRRDSTDRSPPPTPVPHPRVRAKFEIFLSLSEPNDAVGVSDHCECQVGIHIPDHPGVGARFAILFPRPDAPTESPMGTPPPAAPGMGVPPCPRASPPWLGFPFARRWFW